MTMLKGTTKDKYGRSLSGVSVEVKNDQFQTIYQTFSNPDGCFELQLPDGFYPYLTAVRDYADKYLEYWAHNVPAQGETTLDIVIDTLEVYGIHAFEARGGVRALSVYFRPMSLQKFQAGEQDIAPDLAENGIQAAIDGQQAEVLVVNRVQEYTRDGMLTAYLIQVAIPDDIQKWLRVDVTLRDCEGNLGCATLFQ